MSPSKPPDANYGAATPDIQGDDATHDTQQLINNTLNSVSGQAYYTNNGTIAGQPASPADGLLSQGYIIPQLMAVQKGQNGLNVAGTPSVITANSAYNPSLATGTAFNSLVNALSVDTSTSGTTGTPSPATITNGSNSFYGGSSVYKLGVNSSYGNTATGNPGTIAITSSNYLFGNFNQNGVRDYDAVVVEGLKALTALEASGAGNSSESGGANSTVINTGVAGLTSMSNSVGGTGATKGDLIVMGDYNSDGVFDGKDLYDMAVGASLTSASAQPTETTSNGVSTFTTGHLNTTAANFGAAVDGGVPEQEHRPGLPCRPTPRPRKKPKPRPSSKPPPPRSPSPPARRPRGPTARPVACSTASTPPVPTPSTSPTSTTTAWST